MWAFKKQFFVFLLCFFLFISYFSTCFVVKAESKIVVPDDFLTITEAIGNANDGDTVFVKSGTYDYATNQTLTINKTISLIGESVENTILNFHPYYYEVSDFPNPPTRVYSSSIIINADNVTISGFTIVPTPYYSQIGKNVVVLGNATQIVDCVITGRVFLESSHNKFMENNIDQYLMVRNASLNVIASNILSRVFLEYSDSNLLHNNTCMGFIIGNEGRSSSNNIISNNLLNGDNYTSEVWGVYIHSSTNNTVHDNYITNYHNVGYDAWGIVCPTNAINNTFYRNIVVNNDRNVRSTNEKNFWDSGSQGNYWSDYNGTDSDQDGIGDTPYIINENNQDNHPLIAPIVSFNVGVWEWTSFAVDVISNSTITNFRFIPESSMIAFDVDGEYGTNGFLRLTIPKDLLYTDENWVVRVNEESVSANITEDASNSYIYLSYANGYKTVEVIGTIVIPENSPSVLFLIIFGLCLLVTYKKSSFKGLNNSYCV